MGIVSTPTLVGPGHRREGPGPRAAGLLGRGGRQRRVPGLPPRLGLPAAPGQPGALRGLSAELPRRSLGGSTDHNEELTERFFA